MRAWAALASALAACATPAPALRPPSLLGTALEGSLPDLDGRPVELRCAACRARVVAVFASWALGARDLLPPLQALAAAAASRGVEVLGVAVDADPRPVRPFLAGLGVTFPVLLDRAAGWAEGKAGLSRAPSVLVLDRAGRVRAVHDGMADETAALVAAEALAIADAEEAR